jgi:putative peptidoglycan lipid II flippase
MYEKSNSTKLFCRMREKDLIGSFSQERIVGGAAVLAVTQFGASVAGLLRDRTLAKTFPGLDIVDVYIAAFRPSDLLFQVCIMAAFSVALVPLLARYKAVGDNKQMSHLLNAAVAVAALLFGGVALILGIFFDSIAPLFTQFEGESFRLYVQFGRIALLTNFLFVFGNAYGQYLITVQRYWIYGITPILYTGGTIVGTLFLTKEFGVYGPIFGTFLGSVLYVLLRFIAVLRTGFTPHFRLWHPDLTEMGWLMIPRVLALGALQFELLLFDRVASGLEAGSVTIHAYARNFQSVLVGIAGIALAQSAFSLMSQAAAQKDRTRFFLYVKKGIVMMLCITIPGAVALYFLAPVAAWLVHLQHVLPTFSLCLLLYAVSIPFESVNHLLLRSFYSLKQTVTPAIFSVLNGAIAIAFAWYFASRFGVYALALGFAVGQVVQLVGLVVLLPRKVRKAMSSFETPPESV